MNKNFTSFLASEIQNSPIGKSDFSVLPVPYERSVSYGGGTANGPQSILEASAQLETWDGRSNPSLGGIHTCGPVDCKGADKLVINNIASAVAGIVSAGSIPVILGGEHAITQGNVLGLIEAGITGFGVIQFDAHADLRDAYENNPYSHASVMKRIVEKGIPVFQLGVRALCEEEIDARDKHGVRYVDADRLAQKNMQSIQLPESFPEKVFVSLDVDGLDPSVFPSTGTPVPGGIGWYQCLNLFESIARQRRIIGFDVVEFAPIEGFHAYDFAAALLTYKMMGIVQRNRAEIE